MHYPKPLYKLIDEFMKMPGVGPKSAQRLAFYVLQQEQDEIESLISALQEVKEKITYCSICFNITEENPCVICKDTQRDHSIICVVEKPVHLLALEKTNTYKGVYHILGGVINPIEGVNPEDLRIKELLTRIKNGNIKEVILAINPNLEGEITSMYISKILKNLDVKVTRIGLGLPQGADLDYSDEITLIKSLEGRREL